MTVHPFEVLRRLGGHATRAQLAPYVGRRALEGALLRGEVLRVGRGAYVLPTLPSPRASAAAARGVLSHACAAEHWGWKTVCPPAAVDVSVPAGAKPKPAEGVRFRWRTLPDDDVVDGVTSPLRTVLDCAGTMPFREGLAVADSALRSGLVLFDELLAGAAVMRGPFSAGARRIAPLADESAANPFESVLRAELIDGKVHGFRTQVEVRTATSNARVDLGDERLKVAVEGDSYTYHGTRAAFAADCARYDELVRAGWLVLRFAWEHAMFHPGWMVGVVRDVVRDRRPGRRTGPSTTTGKSCLGAACRSLERSCDECGGGRASMRR
jgi:very-short-patch-repair endonuclease